MHKERDRSWSQIFWDFVDVVVVLIFWVLIIIFGYMLIVWLGSQPSQ